MGEKYFKVDLVEFLANIIYGEFFEGVHHLPHDLGGRCDFHPDYSFSFSLKSFLNGYRKTLLMFLWTRCVFPFLEVPFVCPTQTQLAAL